ncbi:hypothetical protein [Acinetobacter tianfuensis]|uniref:DUF4199 domain-containing protein n=1 Tax=Acinetobacter tianfuensis TaxID=2419603 RepID=A0A3A8E6S9_9GAMM|nr:hypothetical protein [Acinetobacter tianfuensis]RKG30537.1 hypothetical protein D7V32_10930 [Acinetobacter tianfuensis]
MTDQSSPEKSPWGWKALILFSVLSLLFMGFFWLAVTNEPDYMPSQQKKDQTTQHAFKSAPAMSEESLAKAQADKEAREAASAQSASEMQMSEEQHANMDSSMQHGNTENGHGH